MNIKKKHLFYLETAKQIIKKVPDKESMIAVYILEDSLCSILYDCVERDEQKQK